MLNKIISTIKPKCLTNFFNKLNFFKDKYLDKAKHYLLGLMNNFKRFNIETLQLAVADNDYTYRQLHYFIDEAQWDDDLLNKKRIQFLENDVRTQTKNNGALAIDDVGVKKYGKHTDGVHYQHYGAEGRNTDCKVAVTSHYVDDTKNFPVDIESYYKGEESKIDLACLLIDHAVLKIRFSWVNFDGWYCNKQVIRKVEEHKKYFVSKLRSDRIIIYQNQRMNVSDLVKIAIASSADNERLFDAGECYIKKLGYYRLVVNTKNSKCFITNNFDAMPENVVDKQYGRRWAIDDFYRQAKDNLSFGQFQIRKGWTIMRHWIMVFLAHTFYVHCRLKGIFAKIYQGAINTLSEFTRVMQNLNIVRVAKKQTNVLLANFGFKSLN